MANLVTLDQIKEYLEIINGSQDARINSLLPMVDSAIEGFTRRTLVEKIITGERHNGDGTPWLMPRCTPIQSVELLEIIDPTDGTSVQVVSASEFNIIGLDTVANDVGQFIALIGAQALPDVFNHPWNGPIFPVGINNLRMNYTAGYKAGSIPSDIQLAAFHTLEFHLNQTASGLKSEKMGDYTYTKFDPSQIENGGIPPAAAGLLKKHKRIRMSRANNAFGELKDRRIFVI